MKTQRQRILFRWIIAVNTASVITLSLFSNSITSQTVWANSIKAHMNSVEFTPPPPPPDRDAPGSRGGGAGRGCGTGSQSVTALMPEYPQALPQGGAITKVWGTTTTEHPTFWFDVPYERGAIAAMEFVLQDNSSPAKDMYRSAIVPPEAPGIVSIHLPATVVPLEVGKLYKWFFKVRLQCGSSALVAKIQKEDLYGWVQRVNLSATLRSQLKQTTPQQRASLYAQNGIWFDALTTLGELRLTNSQDSQLMKDWNSLLQAIGLEKLAAKPLASCCKSRRE
jgi:hypothetical protein